MKPLYRGSSMKRQKGSKGRPDRKKKKRNFFPLWKLMSSVGSIAAKFSCIVMGLLVISLFFVYLYGCLLKSPYLRLEKIIITGLKEEAQEEMLDSAGLKGPLSLLSIDLDGLKEEIESRPWIRRVVLEKRFPHTLIIRVEREEAWALVRAEKLYFLNRWGEIITEAAGDMDYPVITGIDFKDAGAKEQLMLAVEVLSGLENQKAPWSLEDLSELHVKKNGIMSLYFSSLPLAIRIRGNGLSARIDDLQKLVKHLRDAGSIHMVKGIDLNYRDAVVVSMKKG